MNPDTATIDECRDYIAQAMGWSLQTDGFNRMWVKFPEGGINNHPIPLTLDAAAGALPEGWSWLNLDFGEYGKCVAQAGTDFDSEVVKTFVCESEPLARFRCAAKAWMQVKGES